jgi:hypothetical protein
MTTVVNVRSSLFKPVADPLGPEVRPELARGNPIVAQGVVANGVGELAGSRYHLINLPSDCILLPATFFAVSTWGFADIRIGTFSDPAALLSVLRSAAAIQQPIVQGDARHAQPLWQALGLAADPGGEIGLFYHAIATATGAGTSRFAIHYAYR